MWAWDRVLCMVYKLKPGPGSDYKKTQTLFSPSEQKNQGWKNLQELNNPVKTFIIQNFCSEYFWHLLIQILFGVFIYQNLWCSCLRNSIFHGGHEKGCLSWLVRFFELQLAANMIKNCKNGRINLCSCGTCLYWTMYWYVECVQS